MARNGRHELVRRGTCPTCGEKYQRLAAHWRGSCSPPALSRCQRTFVAGLLLGNGCVIGNGTNKHFQLTTRWRPFAAWVFRELDWLAATVVRFDDSGSDPSPDATPTQQYLVRTHAHPGLTRFRAWYAPIGNAESSQANPGGNRDTSGGIRWIFPAPEELPTGRLTPRAGRAWHATVGTLGWSNPEYASTRQAYFPAQEDDRAEAVVAMFE